MKKIMEKISILSLSLVLTTSFSISSALPAMFDFYKGYPADKVELLVSLPSVGIMVMLVLNSFLERFLSERTMIVTGLLVMSLCAFVPLFNQSYGVVFLSRLIFGLGTGMINAKAISIISERYHGKERVQLLGYRGSAEVVGTALLTLIVGQLLRFGWTVTFLAYSFCFLVLGLFLFFVPYEKGGDYHNEQGKKEKMTSHQLRLTLLSALVSGVIVLCNTTINLRVPSLVVSHQIGTPEVASLVLSAMQLIGIVAGISFATMVGIFKGRLLTIVGICFGLGLILIGLSQNIWFLGLSALFAGFTYSTSLTTVFHVLSEKIPLHQVNQAVSITVLGCSGGASITTFVLSFIGGLSSDPIFIFSVLGIMMMGMAIISHFITKEEHASR